MGRFFARKGLLGREQEISTAFDLVTRGRLNSCLKNFFEAG